MSELKKQPAKKLPDAGTYTEEKSRPFYEYRTASLVFDRSHEKLADNLNAYARDGWRIMDIDWPNGFDHAFVLMERELDVDHQ